MSSSLQGLKQSTKSGNRLLFDLSTPQAAKDTFAGNNKGINHFEESGIIPAIFAAADGCGIDLSGLE